MEHRPRPVAWLLALCAVTSLSAAGQASRKEGARQTRPMVVKHDLHVRLEPAAGRLAASDSVTLPVAARHEFTLNARLNITKATPAVDEVAAGKGGLVKRYRVRSASRTLALEYEGVIDFALSAEKEQYTRGFRETAGTVSKDGVYLAGTSGWYPEFGSGWLLQFTMEVTAPADWHVISQGSGGSRVAEGLARWTSRDPTDEIHLVGGPLTVSSRQAGPVEALVYLHQKDSELSERYLTTGAQYLQMYGRLIGPYPYDKFALVENFWETGYGMPSFTLLGPQVIRFPFILHSSYPHEILHNWWGNSVFVDYEGGNWCEGLTAYLADHLVQEQQGKGADHRRAALQKYRDYVKEGRDFPLSAFRSRHSAATEAVGYGKAMMVFHMLRRRMGDPAFVTLLRQLYSEYRGARAGWADVRRLAGKATGSDLSVFFTQWLSRPGAVRLDATANAGRGAAGFVVKGTIRQAPGPDGPFTVSVPVVVQMESGSIAREVAVSGATTSFEVRCPSEPLALHVDPYFDVFRLLDPRETPPAISQIFGEPRIVAVLPSKAGPEALAAYRSLVGSWQSESHAIEVRLDSEMTAMPTDKSAWVLGRDNRFAPEILRAQPGLGAEDDGLRLDGRPVPFANHSAVVVVAHPANPEKAIGLIDIGPTAAAAGIARRLPHYGKYSYLAFEGPAGTNVLSGMWRQTASPLRVDLRAPESRTGPLPALPGDPAKALAQRGS